MVCWSFHKNPPSVGLLILETCSLKRGACFSKKLPLPAENLKKPTINWSSGSEKYGFRNFPLSLKIFSFNRYLVGLQGLMKKSLKSHT